MSWVHVVSFCNLIGTARVEMLEVDNSSSGCYQALSPPPILRRECGIGTRLLKSILKNHHCMYVLLLSGVQDRPARQCRRCEKKDQEGVCLLLINSYTLVTVFVIHGQFHVGLSCMARTTALRCMSSSNCFVSNPGGGVCVRDF